MLKQAEVMTPTEAIDFSQEVILESVYNPAISLAQKKNAEKTKAETVAYLNKRK